MCYLLSFFSFAWLKNKNKKPEFTLAQSQVPAFCLSLKSPVPLAPVYGHQTPGVCEMCRPGLGSLSALQAGLASGWNPSAGQAELMACPPGP